MLEDLRQLRSSKQTSMDDGRSICCWRATMRTEKLREKMAWPGRLNLQQISGKVRNFVVLVESEAAQKSRYLNTSTRVVSKSPPTPNNPVNRVPHTPSVVQTLLGELPILEHRELG